MAREILVLVLAWSEYPLPGTCREGHKVTLVDRKAPGRETSFGNAGLIQREAVFPMLSARFENTAARAAQS